MNLLYSDILPLGTEDGQQTITERFTAELQKADRLDIAVGYLSGDSLEELDRLTEELHISRVTLIAGMYYSDGIPESIFHATKRINLKWKNEGRGEIRFVRPFKYHGKVYCFYKNGKPFAAMLGSANLGFIKPTASNLRQYELDAVTEDPARVEEIARHIASLTEPRCSANMDEIRDFSLIEETNGALQDVELVHQVPTSDVLFYKDCPPLVSFSLPIKVPAESEKHMDDGKHFTKSNINVCYAAPRSKRKPRDWYETQLTVSVKIYTLPGYPEKNKPFMVVTDDGYRFKAHTTSDHNKQFSARLCMHHTLFSVPTDDARNASVRNRAPASDHASKIMTALRLNYNIHIFSCRKARSEGNHKRRHLFCRPEIFLRQNRIDHDGRAKCCNA